MARLVIENLTLVQAKELAHWYEGQGEQDANIWFECQDPPCSVPYVDVHRKPWMQIDDNTVTIYCNRGEDNK